MFATLWQVVQRLDGPLQGRMAGKAMFARLAWAGISAPGASIGAG